MPKMPQYSITGKSIEEIRVIVNDLPPWRVRQFKQVCDAMLKRPDMKDNERINQIAKIVNKKARSL